MYPPGQWGKTHWIHRRAGCQPPACARASSETQSPPKAAGGCSYNTLLLCSSYFSHVVPACDLLFAVLVTRDIHDHDLRLHLAPCIRHPHQMEAEIVIVYVSY